MKLTVLGRYGPYPPAGGCCSGYLLQVEEYNVLLECGNGVLSRLQQHLEPYSLNAVLLSHLHSDHISDIFILRYNLLYAMEQGFRKESLPLYTPPEPVAEFERFPYKGVYSVEKVEPETVLQFGSVELSFNRVQHSVKCFGVKVKVKGKKLFAFSGDAEYSAQLEELAEGCELFLCEANYLDEDIEKGATNHMSARQAAAAASRSGAKKLLLTHLKPEKDEKQLLKEAREEFSGAELAVEGREYII